MKRALAKIPKLEARNSRDVFALFSALNVMGYDDENNPAGMSPLRKKVRKILGQHDWAEKYPHLQREAKIGQPWWALNAILAKTKNVKKSSRIGCLFSELGKFSKEPPVRKLWPTCKTEQNKEIRKLTRTINGKVPRLIAFTGQPSGVNPHTFPRGIEPRGKDLKRPFIPAARPRGILEGVGIKKIIFTANPLDAYWRGYAFGNAVGFWRGPARTGYVVVGPGAEKNQDELIRHELSHIIAPPLNLPRKIIGRRSKRLTKMGYTTLRIIEREYVIRALNFLYESQVLKKDITSAVRKEQKDFPRIREAMRFMKAKINPLSLMS